MQVIRFSNLYVLRKNLCPDVIALSSVYKLCYDYNVPYNRKYLSTLREVKEFYSLRTIHTTSSMDNNISDVTSRFLAAFRDVRMDDMRNAPTPMFWYSAAALLPFVATPISFLLFGYSPLLATAQLAFGATLCSFSSGMKWAYTLDGSVHQPDWQTLSRAVIPHLFGWVGLVVPQSIGFLLVAKGMLMSTYVDLIYFKYPDWFRSIQLAFIIPAMIGLFLTFIVKIFH